MLILGPKVHFGHKNNFLQIESPFNLCWLNLNVMQKIKTQQWSKSEKMIHRQKDGRMDRWTELIPRTPKQSQG